MTPKVVIIGRPNVGKSSLMNLLAGRRISIVDPTPGVTRDRVSTMVSLPGQDPLQPTHHIELIDTGGYGIEDSQNLTAEVEQQIAYGMAEAHLILFVVDAQTGLVPLDHEVLRLLRSAQGKKKGGKPILLVTNKVDSPKLINDALESLNLGLGHPIFVSANTGWNKTMLIEAIRKNIDFDALEAEPEKPGLGLMLAIVGKRNAGKSTLVNALAGQERVIVSEIEGTTRDSVDVRFEIDGQVYTAIDTAGLRKTKSLDGDIEYYSQHRSLRSVRRADVIFFMLDATIPVSQVDQLLSNEVLKHHKPVIVVVNKWDLAQAKATQDDYMEYLDKELQGLNFAPVAFVTAKEKTGLTELLQTAKMLKEQSGTRVPTAQLNDVLEKIIHERPPSSPTGKRPKIYYVTQIDIHPPTIALFVNDQQAFDTGYQRYLMHRFRELLPYPEVPIRLLLRGKPGAGEKQDTPS